MIACLSQSWRRICAGILIDIDIDAQEESTLADITVHKNADAHRFEAMQGDTVVGTIDYVEHDGVIDLPHTLVPPEYEGQGIGSALVRQTLDLIRDDGEMRVTPTCPFIAAWISRHPEYQDLVAAT